MNSKSAEHLWQDYRFLTKEMLKFLEKQDMELFYELMDQRERLQSMIEKTPDNGFKRSPEGRIIYEEIGKANQEILYHLQVKYGQLKRHRQVANAYSGVSTSAVSRMNWKR